MAIEVILPDDGGSGTGAIPRILIVVKGRLHVMLLRLSSLKKRLRYSAQSVAGGAVNCSSGHGCDAEVDNSFQLEKCNSTKSLSLHLHHSL